MAYEKKEYKESDAYNSAYADTITELVGKVSNGEKFNYNPLTDQAYQAYASQYNRLGNEARQNTLNDVAINTGGLASSYAATAASQAQNVYNQALTDKIPELEALAYEKYSNDRNYNLNALSSLQALEDSSYSKYADNRDYQRGKYEYDQNFDFNQYTDERNFVYQQDRDKVSDSQFDKTYDLDVKNYKLNKQQQEWSQKFQKHQDEWQRMYNKWTTMGYANKQVAKYFGIKQGTKTSDQKYKDAQLALSYAQLNKSSGGSSGGSGGSRSSGGGNSSDTTKTKGKRQKKSASKVNVSQASVYFAQNNKYFLSDPGKVVDDLNSQVKKGKMSKATADYLLTKLPKKKK